MPALQVKDCPQHVYDQLRMCASNEDRSMAQQTIHILKRYLNLYQQVQYADNPEDAIFVSSDEPTPDQEERERQARIKKREALFARIRAQEPILTPEGFPTPAEMIREDRDNRPYIRDLDGEEI